MSKRGSFWRALFLVQTRLVGFFMSPVSSEEVVGTNPEVGDRGGDQFLLFLISEHIFARNGDKSQGQFDNCLEDLMVVLVGRIGFEPCVRVDFYR